MPQRYPQYSEATKQRIVQYVLRHPGHTGGEVANILGLDRSRVNSFLYSEGRSRFGLLQNNWRWSAGNLAPRREDEPRPEPPRETSMPTASICGSLARLGITEAILVIRGMTEERINLAFAEDDYSMLDDRLRAELAMRRSELMNSKPVVATSQLPFSNRALLTAIGLMTLLFLVNMINSRPSSRVPYDRAPTRLLR